MSDNSASRMAYLEAQLAHVKKHYCYWYCGVCRENVARSEAAESALASERQLREAEQAISEGRLKALNEKAGELCKEWQLREAAEAKCLKHVGHEHCVTPCDSIRIQEANHTAYLLMSERVVRAEASLAERDKRIEELEKAGEWLRWEVAWYRKKYAPAAGPANGPGTSRGQDAWDAALNPEPVAKEGKHQPQPPQSDSALSDVLEDCAKEAEKERIIFFTKDDIPHQERDLRVRKQMRKEIAEAIRALKPRPHGKEK